VQLLRLEIVIKIALKNELELACKWHHDTLPNDIQQNVTLSIMTLSIIGLSIIGLSIIILRIMSLSIMTLSIKGVYVTVSIKDTKHK
jgi:hypothetical protein